MIVLNDDINVGYVNEFGFYKIKLVNKWHPYRGVIIMLSGN
jgi:hypothetical protein